MRKSTQAVIVEGYTDALMAHQAGFDNVVASLGTALTPGQVALLTRYAKRIALAYDVDAAGQKAGTFGVQALEGLIGQLAATESGIELDEVKVVRLPDDKDPDEVLRDTPDRWREEVRTAQPIVDYLIDTYTKSFDLKTPGGKARFVDALMPTIRAVPNPVMRDGWLQRVRQVSGVEERVLLEVLRSGRSATGLADPSAGREGRFTADAVIGSADALSVGDILRGVLPQEQELLRLLLLVPEVQIRITESIGPDRLPNTVARELFRAIVLAREPDDNGIHPPFSLTALVQSLDPGDRGAGPGARRPDRTEPADAQPGRPRLRDRAPRHRPRGTCPGRTIRVHPGRHRRGRAGRGQRDRGPAAPPEPGDQRAAPIAEPPARADPPAEPTHRSSASGRRRQRQARSIGRTSLMKPSTVHPSSFMSAGGTTNHAR